MKTDYLDDAKATSKRIDADKAERIRREKLLSEAAIFWVDVQKYQEEEEVALLLLRKELLQ